VAALASRSPMAIAKTWLGMKAIGGDPSPLQLASDFAREENVAKLGATIGFQGPKAFRQLQILEIQLGSLVCG
jgi:hypothetical protein